MNLLKQRIITNPFLDYKNPEIQKSLQSWYRTCNRVAKENDRFADKQKKRIEEDLFQSNE